MTIAPDFRMLSPESAHPCDVPLQVMIDEALRELAGRRQRHPGYVATERMTERESAHELAVMASIVADLRMAQASWRPSGIAFAPDKTVTWTAKVETLRRELAIRRAAYPRWIERGQLNAAVAHGQMERLEAIHWMYWVNAMFWLPDERMDDAATLAATRAFMRAHLPAYHAACDQRADTTEQWPIHWQQREQAA